MFLFVFILCFFLFLILFSVLTLPFLILSSASLYFYLLLLLIIFFLLLSFFNVNMFKLHPSKQTSLNNVISTLMVYPRPAFIPGLFYYTLYSFFCFSYTYSSVPILCGYFTFEISNFPSSLERKSNLMPAHEKISIPKGNLCSCHA